MDTLVGRYSELEKILMEYKAKSTRLCIYLYKRAIDISIFHSLSQYMYNNILIKLCLHT